MFNFFEIAGQVLGSARTAFRSGYSKSSDWETLESIWGSVTGGSTVNRKRSPQMQLREYQSWIYIILTTIYGRTSTVPWKLQVQRPNNEYEDLKTQFEHPLYKLLNQPNPWMTGTAFQQMIQICLDLTGMAFIWKVKNKLRRATELWPLNVAEFVDFKTGGTTRNFITGYKFTNMEFAADEIIYLYYPNPDPFYFSSLSSSQQTRMIASLAGMSPIQAMARTVDTEKYIEVYERDFFENSARPDVILTTAAGTKYSPEQKRRLLENWVQKHQGPRKFWEPTVLAGMTAEVLKTNNRDFELVKLANWTKDMLFAAYSVPEGKVGLIKDINRANQIGVDITFNEECILPRLMLWDETFTNQLAKEFDEKLVVVHDNPVPADREFELKRDEFEVKSFVKTINDIRKRDGLEAVPWGDKPWIPFNLYQPGESAGGGNNSNSQQPPEEEPAKRIKCNCGEHNSTLGDRTATGSKESIFQTEEQRVAYWKVFDARARKHEKVFITLVRRLFEKQRKEVLKNLDSIASQIESLFAGWSKIKIAKYVKKNPGLINQILFDENSAVKEFKGAANPAIADAFEEAGQAVLTDIGIDIDLDLENVRARKFIGDRTEFFGKEVNKTTADDIRRTLKEGFSEGENIQQLAKRVKSVYDLADRTRAITIARTEIIASSNAGSWEGMKQSGVVKKKEWLSSRDDRVRDSHLAPLDGQVVGIYDMFVSNDGNQAPYPGGFARGSEDINCRCTVAPVIEV